MFARIIGNYLKYLANYTPVSTWINPIFETGNILEFKFKNFSFLNLLFFSAEIIRSKHFYEYSCLSSFFLRAGCSRIWFKLIASGFIQDIFDAAVYFSNHHIRILFFWTKQFFLCQNFQVYIISFAQNEQWSHHSEYQLNLHFIFSSLFLRRRVFCLFRHHYVLFIAPANGNK